MLSDWHRSVPSGWHDIADQMLRDIDAVAGVGSYSIVRIKDRLGRLECDLDWQKGVDTAIMKQVGDIIDAARRQSLTQCQFCGKSGHQLKVAENWSVTICDAHHAEIEAMSKRVRGV